MADEIKLKATSSKLGDRTVLINCWMEGTVTSLSNKDWITTIYLEGSPFGYLLLQEEDSLLRLCLAFLQEDLCLNNNLMSIEVFIEGIHPSLNVVQEIAASINKLYFLQLCYYNTFNILISLLSSHYLVVYRLGQQLLIETAILMFILSSKPTSVSLALKPTNCQFCLTDSSIGRIIN